MLGASRLFFPEIVVFLLHHKTLHLSITLRTSLVDDRPPAEPWCSFPEHGTVVVCIGRLHHGRYILLTSSMAFLPVGQPACALPRHCFLGGLWGCRPRDHPSAPWHAFCANLS